MHTRHLYSCDNSVFGKRVIYGMYIICNLYFTFSFLVIVLCCYTCLKNQYFHYSFQTNRIIAFCHCTLLISTTESRIFKSYTFLISMDSFYLLVETRTEWLPLLISPGQSHSHTYTQTHACTHVHVCTIITSNLRSIFKNKYNITSFTSHQT